MTFSELVKFKIDLQTTITQLSMDQQIKEKIDVLKNRPVPNNYNEYFERSEKDFYYINDINQKIILELKSLEKIVEQDIDQLAKEKFNAKSQKKHFPGLGLPSNLIVTKQIKSVLVSRLGTYVSWKYPGLIAYPRSRSMIKELVALDPLYILHDELAYIDQLTKRFPAPYQNRLRKYIDKSLLPKNQFGFILIWDVFNYIPFYEFEQYLTEVFSLLRPGGVCMFSYTNCDIEGPARRAEFMAASYANIRLVSNLTKELEFDIVFSIDIETGDAFNTHVSWIEIQKPGRLATLKEHQSLAKIFTK